MNTKSLVLSHICAGFKSHSRFSLFFSVLLWLLVSVNFSAAAQTSYAQTFEEAQAAEAGGNATEAIAQYELLVQTAMADAPEIAFKSAVRAGFLYYFRGKNTDAIALYRQVASLLPSMAAENRSEYAYRMGESFFRLGQSDSAIYYYKQVLLIADTERSDIVRLRLCQAYTGVANVHRWILEDPYKANQYFLKALSEAELLPPEQESTKDIVFRIYYNLATNYRIQAMEERALSAAHKASDILTTFNKPHLGYQQRVLMLLGNAYASLENFDFAFQYYSQCITLMLENQIDDTPALIATYNNLGLLFRVQGKAEEALKYYYKSKHLIDSKQKLGLKLKVDLSTRLAILHKNEAQHDSAKHYLLYAERALLPAKPEEYVAERTELAILKANFLAFDQQFAQAIDMAQEALSTQLTRFSSTDWAENPPLEELRYFPMLFSIISQKAVWLHELALRTPSPDSQRLSKLSQQTFLYADSLIRRYRLDFSRETSELKFSAGKNWVYEQALAAFYYQYQQDGKGVHEAFRMMENSKGQILARSFAAVQAQFEVKLPDSLAGLERQLQFKLGNLASMSVEATNLEYRRAIEQQVLEIDEQFDALNHRLQKEFPAYYEAKYGYASFSMPTLRSFITEKPRVLVSYFWGDKHLYGISLFGDQHRFVRLPIDRALEENIRQYRALLAKGYRFESRDADFQQFTKQAHWLYDTFVASLLPEDLKAYQELVLIPDGPLANLNFEALLTEKVTSTRVDYRSLPYFVRQISTISSFSAHMLLQAQAPQQKAGSTSLLGFGYTGERDLASLKADKNGFASSRSENEVLPGTLQEINSVMKMLKGEFFKGAQASENSFKKKAGEFDILHLALHGIADSDNPYNSRLLFQGHQEGAFDNEDEILHAHELYSLKLRAKLAVLSACETGVGKLHQGEGIYSMGRAFAYAGCPTVIMSLWNIDDGVSAQLITDFYTHLKTGESSAEGLWKIKNNYIGRADEFTAHPYYWAAFVNMGPTASFDFSESYISWIFWGSIASLLSAVALAMLYKRVSRL